MNTKACSLLSLTVAAFGLLAASSSGQTYFGGTVAVGTGGGWMRAYVQYNSDTPARIGVQMNQAAFSAYSSLGEVETVLTLPMQTPAPFNHLMVDWNPEGHPGPGYNAPHFDFHFYLTSPESVASIPFSLNPVAVNSAYVPSDYLPDAVVVPGMGQHYLDLLAPEFNGGEFTRTFVYGYYDGRLTFLEPMITYAYLAEQHNATSDIRQPAAFELAGSYPTEYGTSYDEGIYSVFLDNLSMAPASPVPEPSTSGALGGVTLIGLVSMRRFRRRRTTLAPISGALTQPNPARLSVE